MNDNDPTKAAQTQQPEPQAQPTPGTPQDDPVALREHVPFRAPYVELAQDDGEWHWMLWAGNGRQLATNARPYANMHDAKTAFKAVQQILRDKVTIVADVS